MYKNQLQELAQRSCFNLPSYSSTREGSDHAPRFKAAVNFNGETFESPTFCSTLRQAEHAAAEVALSTLANRGPSRALASRVLDETGVYKNLLQETAHRAGLMLPVYTTVRSEVGHVSLFSCTVELAGMRFTGEPARTKKQAQKNAAMAAWSALKKLIQHGPSTSGSSTSVVETRNSSEEQEKAIIARFLASLPPSNSNNFKPSDEQQGQERYTPISKELNPRVQLHCPTWVYPNISPEFAIYQMQQQEHFLQIQNHLLAHQIPPRFPPAPQFLPFVHPVLPPDSRFFIPVSKQEHIPGGSRVAVGTSRPLLYASDSAHPVGNPTGGNCTVDIHDESSDCSASMVPEQLQKSEPIQQKHNQTVQTEQPSDGSIETGAEGIDFRIRNPYGLDPLYPATSPVVMCPQGSSSPGSFVSSYPGAARNPGYPLPMMQNLAARIPGPPRMRTGADHYSVRPPMTPRMNSGGVHPHFRAPAVRLRSVVPVCSAPPARELSSPRQQPLLPQLGKQDLGLEETSSASSELSKVHI